ncbi:MAG: hypothetical protein N3G74_01360 [Candidatus Micrarchaeota archaeon]|nr:hypothetical protein [Candidatus Micrarchaeota archaeon]
MDDEIVSLADNIIAILKQRKIIELSELVKETGANEQDIKLIINLLEKEEMVDVGYSLTKVLISWNDEADRILMKMKKNQKIISLNSEDLSKASRLGNKSSVQAKSSEKSVPTDFTESKFSILREKQEEKQVETNAQESQQQPKYKKEGKSKEVKRESSYKIGGMAVKDREINENEKEDLESEDFTVLTSKAETILKKKADSLEDQPDKKQKLKSRKDQEIEKEIKEIERNILLRISGESDNGDSAHIISLKDSDIVKEAVKSNSKARTKEYAKQRLLGKYKSDQKSTEETETYEELEQKLNQIVNKRAEIADLNKQKTVLFDSTYPEIKSKLSAQIQAMELLMNEKEEKLKELRNRIDSLPTSLEETEQILKSLKEKQEKLNSSFNSIIQEIKEAQISISEMKSDYLEEFNLIRNQIIEHEKELIRINNIYSSLREKEERLKNSITFVRETVSKSQEELLNLEGQLEKLNSLSRSIEMKIEDTNKVLKSLNHKFEGYANRMRDLDIFDAEIREIEEEYSDKKRKIDEKIKGYADEVFSLSKSIELEASSRYLKELEKMLAVNEESFNSLLLNEKEINKKIDEKKTELKALLEQAKQLQSSVSRQNQYAFSQVDPEQQASPSLAEYGISKEFEEKRVDSSLLSTSAGSNVLSSNISKAKETLSKFLSRFSKK